MFVRDTEQMLREQVIARGITNDRVLAAMRAIDRKRFVSSAYQDQAYSDGALPVSHGATISQPYIVALMTDLADLQPSDRILEIGCGTGYQTAILACLCREVWSLEIIAELATAAASRLREIGIQNAHVLNRSGWAGLPEQAPFEKIIVTAAPDQVPILLRDQLAPCGRLVVPIGPGEEQQLMVITHNTDGSFSQREVTGVRFVPMVRRAGDER